MCVLIIELLPTQSVLSVIGSTRVLLEFWILLRQTATGRLLHCYLVSWYATCTMFKSFYTATTSFGLNGSEGSRVVEVHCTAYCTMASVSFVFSLVL